MPHRHIPRRIFLYRVNIHAFITLFITAVAQGCALKQSGQVFRFGGLAFAVIQDHADFQRFAFAQQTDFHFFTRCGGTDFGSQFRKAADAFAVN